MVSPHYGIDANVLIGCATAIFAAVIYGEKVVLKLDRIFQSFCTPQLDKFLISNSYNTPCSHHEPEAWQESGI
jgi:hypothetical protein